MVSWPLTFTKSTLINLAGAMLTNQITFIGRLGSFQSLNLCLPALKNSKYF